MVITTYSTSIFKHPNCVQNPGQRPGYSDRHATVPLQGSGISLLGSSVECGFKRVQVDRGRRMEEVWPLCWPPPAARAEGRFTPNSDELSLRDFSLARVHNCLFSWGLEWGWGCCRKEDDCPKKKKTKQQTLRGTVLGLSDSEIFLWYLKLSLHKNSTSALNHDSFPPSTPSLGQPFKL